MRSQREDGFQILTSSRGRHIRYPCLDVPCSNRCVPLLCSVFLARMRRGLHEQSRILKDYFTP